MAGSISADIQAVRNLANTFFEYADATANLESGSLRPLLPEITDNFQGNAAEALSQVLIALSQDTQSAGRQLSELGALLNNVAQKLEEADAAMTEATSAT